MLKILIADDEQNVCKLLHSLINWDGLRLACAGMTVNGEEAYRMALETRPDIIITDIRMPVIDGLEMIRLVKEAGLASKFIIVSGYHSFDYAHQAIKYGVSDFLTKPINGEELHNTLLRLCREVLTSQQNDQALAELEFLNSRLANLSQVLRHQFVAELSAGKELPKQGLDAVNENYMYHFSPGLFCVAAIYLDLRDPSDSYYRTIVSQMAHIVRDDLLICCCDIEVLEQERCIFAFANYSADKQAEFMARLNNSYSHLRELIKPYPFYAVTVGVSKPVTSLEAVGEAMRQAELCIKSRVTMGTGQIIRFESLPKADQAVLPLCKEAWDEIGREISLRNAAGVLAGFERLYSESLPQLSLAAYRAADWFYACFDRLATAIVEAGFPCPEPLIAEKRQELKNASSLQELADTCIALINESFALYEEEMQRSNTHTIQVAKQYIAENYGGKLELEAVAKQVYLSPAYFGILFKRETGQNFTDYLIRVRVEKAKQLLGNMELSIAEISTVVGYRDVRHFVKVFKREVSVTPAEYRKIRHFR